MHSNCLFFVSFIFVHSFTVRTLLQHGADPNATQNEANSRTTALYRASQDGYVDVVIALLEDGRTDVNACTFCITHKANLLSLSSTY